MSRTIDLINPIETADKAITQLTFKDITIGHLKAMSREDGKSALEKEIAFVALVADISPAIVEKLSAEDWVVVDELVQGELKKFQPTPSAG